MIIQQRDLTWPSPGSGVANLRFGRHGIITEVTFNTMQIVGDLIQAELQLFGSVKLQLSSCV